MPKARKVLPVMPEKLQIGDCVVNYNRWTFCHLSWNVKSGWKFGHHENSGEFIITETYGIQDLTYFIVGYNHERSRPMHVVDVVLSNGETATLAISECGTILVKNPNYEEEKVVQRRWKLEHGWYEMKRKRRRAFADAKKRSRFQFNDPQHK